MLSNRIAGGTGARPDHPISGISEGPIGPIYNHQRYGLCADTAREFFGEECPTTRLTIVEGNYGYLRPIQAVGGESALPLIADELPHPGECRNGNKRHRAPLFNHLVGNREQGVP